MADIIYIAKSGEVSPTVEVEVKVVGEGTIQPTLEIPTLLVVASVEDILKYGGRK